LVSLIIYIVGFAIYVTVPPATWKDPASPMLWVLVVLLLMGVIAGNIRTIALPTIITILFPGEGRDKANGLAGTPTGIAFLIVSAISGFLVGHSGLYMVLILAILLMLASIIHLALLSIPERELVRTGQGMPRLDIRGTFIMIAAMPGLLALIFFTTINNFLGGVFMGLMDAYGLSFVSVQVWGTLWAILSLGFIVGGLIIARWGLGKNPLFALFAANICIWSVCCVFTLQSSVVLLSAGMFIYLAVVPYIEAAEHTIIQKLVPLERQGRVFGFAQSVEMAASPITTFFIGPIAQLIFIPFMTTGAGVDLIGGWFGTGADRGIALVFTLTGIIGLCVTLIAMNSRYYRLLSDQYMARASEVPSQGEFA
jgi:DHA3 family multidrug efflux protein-like MFS transporter